MSPVLALLAAGDRPRRRLRTGRAAGGLRRRGAGRRAAPASRRSCSPAADPRAPADLFLDGRLQVSGRDEYRYHEALVHPAMAAARTRRVLVLGGGDGLAAREVLRYRGRRVGDRRRARPGRGAARPHGPGALRPQRGAPTAIRGCGWSPRTRSTGCARPSAAYDVVISRPARPRAHPEHQAVLPGVLRPGRAGPRRRRPARRARGAGGPAPARRTGRSTRRCGRCGLRHRPVR